MINAIIIFIEAYILIGLSINILNGFMGFNERLNQEVTDRKKNWIIFLTVVFDYTLLWPIVVYLVIFTLLTDEEAKKQKKLLDKISYALGYVTGITVEGLKKI